MEEEDIQEALDACIEAMDSGIEFTEWEQDFLQDVGDQYLERGTLTERQLDVLGTLWDRALND